MMKLSAEEEEDVAATPEKNRTSLKTAKGRKKKMVISDDETYEESEEEGEADETSYEEETSEESRGEVPSGKETEGETALSNVWSDEEHTFTSRSNLNEALAPQGMVSDMPAHILAALMTVQDKAYLNSLNELKLAALQSYLSIGSALVAKRISNGSKDRLQCMKDELEVVEELMAKKAELEKKLDQMELDFSNHKNSLLIENRQLADDALSWEKKYIAAIKEREAEEEKRQQEGKAWEKKIAAQEEKAKRCLQEHHAQIAALKKKVEVLKAAALVPSASMSVDEASAIYRETDDFKVEMGGFGDMGVQMLKAAIVKDGKMKEEDLNAYDYLKVMERVERDEL